MKNILVDKSMTENAKIDALKEQIGGIINEGMAIETYIKYTEDNNGVLIRMKTNDSEFLHLATNETGLPAVPSILKSMDFCHACFDRSGAKLNVTYKDYIFSCKKDEDENEINKKIIDHISENSDILFSVEKLEA